MIKKGLFSFFTIISICANAQFGFERSTIIEVVEAGDLKEMAWAGGMDYCQFSNIDLDFDGDEDLFAFDRTSNQVLTFIQNGGPGEIDYVYAPEYESQFPEDLVNWVLLVDYDCDGKKDIFTNVLGSGKVFRNTGNAGVGNSFELVKPLLVTLSGGSDTYMYIGKQDIPSITDVDGDGDKDVLTFGVLGRTVEYHKNMSMELYGTCDSLEFETKNKCWGRFREANASNMVTLWDTLESPCEGVSGEEVPHEVTDFEDRQDRHVGSTVLALDMTNSGVMDLLLGDVSYNNLVLLLNEGTEVNTNSGMYAQDGSFPATSDAVDIPVFPAAYHVDIDNDNVRDLIVAPNSKVGSNNVEGVWRYMNEGEDTAPNFIKEGSTFLQGEMIDLGTAALPVFFDHNGDGLKDLLISSQSGYNEETGEQTSKISYYENTGTIDAPKYTFVTADYQGISEYDLGASLVLYPTFGDLDGDGDEDMILGEYIGYCYYLENTGGEGSPAVFNTFTTLTNSAGANIFSGVYVYPNLVDLDRDGDQDLVIGRRTGKLEYYENTGVGTYNFEYVTTELGGVDVSGGEGFVEGHAITQFVDIDGEYHLLVGSKNGDLFYYDDIESNIDGVFHLVDASVDDIKTGTFTAPAVANINNNNRFEMVLGNKRGGVVLFESAPTDNIGLPQYVDEKEILIYPNPANELVSIDLGTISADELKLTRINVYSIEGKLLMTIKPDTNLSQINTSHLSNGTYIIQIVDGNKSIEKKLVIQ